MKFTEDKLKLFAAPLSETENQKCLNAIGMIRDSLKMLGFTDDNKSISKLYEDTYAYSLEMRSTYDSRFSFKVPMQIILMFAHRAM